VVELQYTGTAFVVGRQDMLITNRHVAVPWENDATHEQFEAMGLTPKFERFIGYFPGVEKSFDVHLVSASDEVDVAVLRCEAAPPEVRPLTTASDPAHPGDEVIVMGYPTGVRAMLARTDTKFLDEIREQGSLDFWTVVEHLSASSLITPLATRGIVGQITPDVVAYDADTTHGGSGGPVLNMRGEVVAVNMAILPEFGGSNLGVPMARILPILNQSLELINSQ
jgi:serine protease Do